MAFITAAAVGNPDVVRFLDLIAFSEGTSTHLLTRNSGYDVIVTGCVPAGEVGLETFTDYSDHPFARGRRSKVIKLPAIPANMSSASGRYQLELKWWRAYKASIMLKDFSPLSQDLVALQQMKERHAISLINSGHIDTAIEACANIWASFPGNNYGQGGHSMETLMAKFDSISLVPVLVPVPNVGSAA